MRKAFLLFVWLLAGSPGCIEPYNPPEIASNDDYLVVQGFVNASTGTCQIKLSRTVALASTEDPVPVTDASIEIEDELGRKFPFTQDGLGSYEATNIFVDYTSRYRIIIADGSDTYTSDFVEPVKSPPIDEVAWKLEEDKVRITVSSHNDEEGSRYYLWKYVETWQYNSAFLSYFKLENGSIVPRALPNELYYCWKDDPSSQILIGTSVHLEADKIDDHLLRELDVNAEQFKTKYSILVSQYSLTKDGYEFWSQVANNTQGTGSLFDTQPSRVTGNIRDDDHKKAAIGFFSVSTVEEKRIFIRSLDLPWPRDIMTRYSNCREDTLHVEDIPDFTGPAMIVNELIQEIEVEPRTVPPIRRFLGYSIASPYCVDCRVTGGSLKRPDFWE